jgi:uncharacterized protein YdeI (YjbR/CyaY-like superfamily)
VPPVIPDPRTIHAFKSQADFERWLSTHHDKESEVFIRIFKKGSGIASVTPAEALDVALCWGWIDAIRKSYDAESFLQRYTLRRPKSIWSQINRENVARLIAAKRMRPPGLAQVEAAKADGRWAAAYAGAAKAVLPDDLLAAIAKVPAAQRAFEGLNSVNRFALGFRVGQLKTPEGRSKRIASFVEMLARGETLHPNGNGPAAKAATKQAAKAAAPSPKKAPARKPVSTKKGAAKRARQAL